MDKYPAIEVPQKTGDERFCANGKPQDNTLLSFWRWSSSDVVGNTMRGIIAEYIVASALGVTDGTRVEWDAYDIETTEGIRVEVKSGAYIQSWAQRKLSNIQFSIRPTQILESKITEAVRQADVYVFCLLQHKDQETIDPLNLDQWEFYVLATETMNVRLGSQKTITLSS